MAKRFEQPTVTVAPGNTYPIELAKYLPDGHREDFPKGGYRINFASLEDFYAEAMRAKNRGVGGSDYSGDKWAGGATWDDVAKFVTDGWVDKAAEVQQISDRALTVADEIAEDNLPQLRFDVYGDECDMGRYFGGEPECMVDWPLTPVAKEGRVITLISSACFSAGVDTDTIIRRGIAVAGLAEALTRMGYSVGIVVDISAGLETGGASLQVTLKHPTDDLHMPRVIYGLAHPSILRMLTFQIWYASSVCHSVQNFGLGPVCKPAVDESDGQIMIPGIDLREDKWNDPEGFIREQFAQLGLIEAD